MIVRSILAAKDATVAMVPSHTSVSLAAQRMRLHRCGALLVSDDGGRTIAGAYPSATSAAPCPITAPRWVTCRWRT